MGTFLHKLWDAYVLTQCKECFSSLLTNLVTSFHEQEIIIIIMYIYHAFSNALSAHMIHINLNMIFYTHVKHSPTKTI